MHGGIRLLEDISLDMLEDRIGNGYKRIVELADCALHLQFAEPAHQLQLDEHVVLCHDPLTSGQFLKFLLYNHVLHEVHVASLRYVQFHSAHLICGVLHDIEIAGEADVLLVVRKESQLYDAVVLYGDGVLQIISVERDG